MSDGRVILKEEGNSYIFLEGTMAKQTVRERVSYDDALALARAGKSFTVSSGPGTGKTSLAVQLAVDALISGDESSSWAPVLVLTPDRRRAEITDRQISAELAEAGANVSSGLLDGPGSHRLVRSVSSYAHLVTGLWSVERTHPIPKIPFASGVTEDAWVTEFLQKQELSDGYGGFSPEMIQSPSFRMELRNVMARAGELGLPASDLISLGEQYGRPLWTLAGMAFSDFAGEGGTPFGPESPHADTARMPRIAAHLIQRWQQDADELGITAQCPVPRLLIVDDCQDLTVSGAALVKELATVAKQTVILGSPDVAAAAYRGGDPHLGEAIGSDLGFDSVELDLNLRSKVRIAAVSEAISKWVAPSMRAFGASPYSDEGFGDHGQVAVAVSATTTGRDVLLSEYLRRQHLFGGVPWEHMAVVVRNARQIETIRRRLASSGVPIQSADRPVNLALVPVCTALLDLLALGDKTEPIEQQVLLAHAMDLLSSPLVSADPLAVFRVVRDLRSYLGQQQITVLELLEMPDADLAKAVIPGDRSRSEVLKSLKIARELWGQKELAATQAPQVGLWQLWELTKLGEVLRQRVLENNSVADDLDDARTAADQLDAVMALFRKADLWSQKRLEDSLGEVGTAAQFAVETLAEQVTSDSLVKGGIPVSGVSVLTATASAGREWPVVCIVGPQSGEWPATGLGSFGNIGELRAIVVASSEAGWPGEVSLGKWSPERQVGLSTPFAQAVKERRVDEARLLNLAVSRASDFLQFFVVDSEDAAPSVLLAGLADGGVIPSFQKEDGTAIYSRPDQSMDLSTLVGSLRRRAIAGESDDERLDAIRTLALLAAEGIDAADPAAWATTGSVSTDAPIIEAGPIRLSPSKIDLAQKCSLRWFLSSVNLGSQDTGDGPVEFNPISKGNLIHEIAEQNPHGNYEQMLQALEEKWEQNGFEKETVWGRRNWEDAASQIARLAEYISTREVVIETEVKMRYELGPAIVSGRIDRLETDSDGSARIVDIKTGKPVVKNTIAGHPQLLAYQLWLLDQGKTSAGAALLELKGDPGKTLALQEPLSEEQAEQVKEQFTDLAQSLSGSSFIPNDSDGHYCDSCEFRFVCPLRGGASRSAE